MENVGKRVRYYRELRKYSQGKLARKAEVSPAYISKLEAGLHKSASAAKLSQVAAVLQVSLSELVGEPSGLQPERPTLPIREERTAYEIVRELDAALRREPTAIMVAVVESFGAAGVGAVAEIEYWPYVPTPEQVGHDIIGIRAKGNCLFPRVRDGDQVYIDRNAIPIDKDIVAVTIDGESLLRIYEATTNQLTSLSGHPPMALSDRIHIEGVAVFGGKRP